MIVYEAATRPLVSELLFTTALEEDTLTFLLIFTAATAATYPIVFDFAVLGFDKV